MTRGNTFTRAQRLQLLEAVLIANGLGSRFDHLLKLEIGSAAPWIGNSTNEISQALEARL
ncbi:hypothetical protein FRIGORI9N_60021 [Frigoribacterium sp. 9N]|nr:hypothetical protein FRIGORI9N_60021 [Frigoribacterium sp. 9N]